MHMFSGPDYSNLCRALSTASQLPPRFLRRLAYKNRKLRSNRSSGDAGVAESAVAVLRPQLGANGVMAIEQPLGIVLPLQREQPWVVSPPVTDLPMRVFVVGLVPIATPANK